MARRTAVVTGASGFIGAALVEHLVHEGIEVYAVVRRGCEHKVQLKHPLATIVECDLSEYDSLSDLICPSEGVDAFYHFAWAGTSGVSRGDSELQLSNAGAACKAVEQAAKLGTRRFVFAASIMEEEVLQIAYRQQAPPSAGHIYSAAKLAADSMCYILAAELGIEYTRAVISNVFGPGEYSARFINTTLRKMIAGEPIKLSTCEQLYDFVYIDDAIEGLLRLGMQDALVSSCYIGNRAPKPLREYVVEMRKEIGSSSDLLFGALGQAGSYPSVFAHVGFECMYDELGFEPSVGFSEGIVRTAEQFADNGRRVV